MAPTSQELFYSLKEEIIETNYSVFFEPGEGIPPETGCIVARDLSEDSDMERNSSD